MSDAPAPGDCTLEATLSRRMRESSRELSRRWLERIADRVSIDRYSIFPTEDLIDHIPILIEGIAEYLGDASEEVVADMPVVAKAIELGSLRHVQGFDASQILKEYEILGGILFEFLIQNVDEAEHCTRTDVLQVATRLFRSISIVQQVTANQYLRVAAEVVRDREQRLRGFNGAVSHEVKNRIGVMVGAANLLQEEFVQKDPERVHHFAGMLIDGINGLGGIVDDLIALSGVETSAAQQRNVLLPDAVAEAVRQLREFASSREVEVRVADDLPQIEVPASVIELCVTNYLSNALKYHDPEKSEKLVEIFGFLRQPDQGERELVVEVHDNGLGVPEDARANLFTRFYRAHRKVTNEEGSGLGLSIVRDVVNSIGGSSWVATDDQGRTVFAFSIPLRDAGPPAVTNTSS